MLENQKSFSASLLWMRRPFGRANISFLHNGAPDGCKEILGFVLEDNHEKKACKELAHAMPEEEQLCRERKPPPKMRFHTGDIVVILDELKRIGMLKSEDRIKFEDCTKRLGHDALVAFANMFMVEKPGKTVTIDGIEKVVLRIITDAKEANMKLSLGYSIFILQALFQCVSNVSHTADGKKGWYCINADVRYGSTRSSCRTA